jgi:hypothetical protein
MVGCRMEASGCCRGHCWTEEAPPLYAQEEEEEGECLIVEVRPWRRRRRRRRWGRLAGLWLASAHTWW